MAKFELTSIVSNETLKSFFNSDLRCLMSVFGVISVIAYGFATAHIVSRLVHHEGPNRVWVYTAAAAALLSHAVFVFQDIFTTPQALGENLSMTNIASLLALLITFSMTVGAVFFKNNVLLPVVYGFAALVVSMALVLPDSYLVNRMWAPSLVTHITFALFAYGCLIIALLYALQLAYIDHQLKHKTTAMLNSPMPPLMVVESILTKLLLTGTVLLTLSLITGFIFLEDMFAKEQAHKTVLSFLALMTYTTVLIGRHFAGWRGSTVIGGTVAGAFLLTLAYFGSRFVREILLA